MHVSPNLLQRLHAEFPLRFGLGGIPDPKLPALIRAGAVPAEFLHDVLMRIVENHLVNVADMSGMVARATDLTVLWRLARHPHAEVRAGVAVCPHTPPEEVERLLLDRSGQVRSAAAARKRGPNTTELAQVHMAILRTKSSSAITQILTAHPEYLADERVQRRLLEVLFRENIITTASPAARLVPARLIAEANTAVEVRGDKFCVFDLGAALKEPLLATAQNASLSRFMEEVGCFVRETLPFTEDEDVHSRSLEYLRPCWAHHINLHFGIPNLGESEYTEMWQAAPTAVLERMCVARPSFASELVHHLPDHQLTNRARYGDEIPAAVLKQVPFETILDMVW